MHYVLLITFTFYKTNLVMFDFLPYLLAFVVALFLGVYLGKLLFSARFQSEKVSLEERLNAQCKSIAIAKRAI